ncbi:MAG: DNA adenine methylase [Caulobacterales bacterium]|uniref:DNA adenine methylase n=1 Tax=Glycocaulis sp. TaxID=1969725 RepID=UPI003FA18BF1
MESSPSPDLFGDIAVDPVAPAAAWLGGKRNLARRLVRLIDSERPRLYAEPFIGMGGVFLRRRIKARVEVINDRSRDVANFFRILQRHYVPFVEMLRWQLSTRTDFERLMATNPDAQTDLERAARFLYLQAVGYGGKVTSRAFGVDPIASSAFNLLTIVPRLEALHARLASVTVECLGYGEFIDRYDRPETLFYCDPPYWGGEEDYGKGLFAREDFATLASQLQGIKGRFILSINDRPEIRELFAWASFEEVEVIYGIGPDKGHMAKELIIRGTLREPS